MGRRNKTYKKTSSYHFILPNTLLVLLPSPSCPPPLNGPISSSPRQRTGTIHHFPPLHPHHTHLDHGTHKRRIPRLFTHSKRRKLQRRSGVPGDVPVGRENKWCTVLACFSVVFYVPDARGGVESGACVGRRDEALFCGRVGADEGGKIGRGEAFGHWVGFNCQFFVDFFCLFL